MFLPPQAYDGADRASSCIGDANDLDDSTQAQISLQVQKAKEDFQRQWDSCMKAVGEQKEVCPESPQLAF